MSARDDILAGLRQADGGTVGDLTPEDLVDAYRVDVLTEAELEIRLATERNEVEYPDVEAMVIRRLGMRAAERVVQGMRAEMAEDKATEDGAR